MSHINFTLTLTSDGEPASGFGTGLTDDLLPRDGRGRVIIPSTHLKGIIRENLETLPNKIIPTELVDELFGRPGSCCSALFHLTDATAPEDATIIGITRTKLNPFGVAEQTTLRSSEAIACGTRFTGKLSPNPCLSAPYTDLLKLGILSLFALGGGRNRGAGACVVTLDNEKRTPGELIKSIARADFSTPTLVSPESSGRENVSDRRILLKLIFTASGPVCVPEIPVVPNNMIRSGFTIPASAVQGAILHRINDVSRSVADGCFASKNFRAWPLNPSDNGTNLSLRAPCTHKVSKSKSPYTGKYHFKDEAIETSDQDMVSTPPPMVSASGVLITDSQGVKFWKSSEMGRTITAHGVHNGDRDKDAPAQKRNLFTVESLSPTVFTGIISIPETACEILLESLEKNPFVQLGKARSVRGGGELRAQKVEFSDLSIMKHQKSTLFIVQSPICVPKNLEREPLDTIIATLAEKAGFGRVKKTWGSMTTRFGWSREPGKGLLPPRTVIEPGTVFKLDSPVNDLEEQLISGLSTGRENGFGAVLPHPGVATVLFTLEQKIRTVPKLPKNFGKEGFELWQDAKDRWLSASQISRVRELVSLDANKALAYLERQRTDRPDKIWDRWKGVINKIETGILTDSEHMAKVLKVCQDLLVADEGGNSDEISV